MYIFKDKKDRYLYFMQSCIYIYFCCKVNWWKSLWGQYYLVLGGRWSSGPRQRCRHSSPLAHQAPRQPTVHWQTLWFHKTWGFPSGRETQDVQAYWNTKLTILYQVCFFPFSLENIPYIWYNLSLFSVVLLNVVTLNQPQPLTFLGSSPEKYHTLCLSLWPSSHPARHGLPASVPGRTASGFLVCCHSWAAWLGGGYSLEGRHPTATALALWPPWQPLPCPNSCPSGQEPHLLGPGPCRSVVEF